MQIGLYIFLDFGLKDERNVARFSRCWPLISKYFRTFFVTIVHSFIELTGSELSCIFRHYLSAVFRLYVEFGTTGIRISHRFITRHFHSHFLLHHVTFHPFHPSGMLIVLLQIFRTLT